MKDYLTWLIRLSHPSLLLAGVLFYALGVGIAKYLGTTIEWNLYFLGQGIVTTIQLGAHFLYEYFAFEPNIHNNLFHSKTLDSNPLTDIKVSRNLILIAVFASLTVSATFFILLMYEAKLSPLTIGLFVFGVLGAIFFSTPPIRLVNTGYGELVESILLANFIPAFGFLLQANELHRLLAMSTFPLTLLVMAAILVFEFPNYARDVKYDRRNLLVRIGWEKGMTLHHIFILCAFLLLAIAVTVKFPWSIALPIVFLLALGVLQIWQMRRIAGGLRPNWRNLQLTAMLLVASYAYLLAFGFWTH
jgi:1,4-dihydroxy-2-naphthoate octaprenyltransferase